jgi:hypothetical protein
MMPKEKIVERFEKRIDRLNKQNNRLEVEMVERGKEISRMIKMFLMVEQLLPEGVRNEFREIAVGYAMRNDEGKLSVAKKGQIEFQDAWHN